MTRPHERRQSPDNHRPAPQRGAFAVDLGNIDTFLELIGDKRLRLTRSGTFELEPAPTRSHPLADELMLSMRPFLRHAYFGACVFPGKPAVWPYAHDSCGSWRLMTKQRSTTACECGGKSKRRRIEIPWADVNHHGRPKNPHMILPKTKKVIPT